MGSAIQAPWASSPSSIDCRSIEGGLGPWREARQTPAVKLLISTLTTDSFKQIEEHGTLKVGGQPEAVEVVPAL